MIINKKEIEKVDLSYFNNLLGGFPYLKNKGEHYQLLTYIGNMYNNIQIIDAGTCNGHSALALSQNKTNIIRSYDIETKNFDFGKNIEYITLDINEENPEVLKDSPIILLDIDPHDGKQEQVFTDYLTKIGYKGYVICDDIFLNEEMANWWNNIQIEKYDVTEIGHFSGTGIINFNQDENFQFN